MDPDQPMVKADRKLVGGVRLVLDPVLPVREGFASSSLMSAGATPMFLTVVRYVPAHCQTSPNICS